MMKDELTYKEKLSKISPEKRSKWEKEQNYIKTLISEVDELPCPLDQINLVAGVDISFSGKF